MGGPATTLYRSQAWAVLVGLPSLLRLQGIVREALSTRAPRPGIEGCSYVSDLALRNKDGFAIREAV
ncbi:MAG TPA: hypothetical protein VHX17_01935 [Candidatus Cybelea sp.]|nr:hypothetical protein [Candidatus Cybelea sp.]